MSSGLFFLWPPKGNKNVPSVYIKCLYHFKLVWNGKYDDDLSHEIYFLFFVTTYLNTAAPATEAHSVQLLVNFSWNIHKQPTFPVCFTRKPEKLKNFTWWIPLVPLYILSLLSMLVWCSYYEFNIIIIIQPPCKHRA